MRKVEEIEYAGPNIYSQSEMDRRFLNVYGGACRTHSNIGRAGGALADIDARGECDRKTFEMDTGSARRGCKCAHHVPGRIVPLPSTYLPIRLLVDEECERSAHLCRTQRRYVG